MMSDATVASLLTFATVVAGFVFQAYRESQARRADREDREQLAKTVVAQAESVSKTMITEAKTVSDKALVEAKAVANEVIAKAEQVAELQRGSTAQLSAEIAANTEISTKAFHEANSVNQKIANLGAGQVALQEQQNIMQDAVSAKDAGGGG